MRRRSDKEVDFERLADALATYRVAYLVTVDDDYRVHTVTVAPELQDRTIAVGLIGGRTRRNVEKHGDVTLLWPPSDPGGYSLIVDGHAEVLGASDGIDDAVALQLAPTRALLHRNADLDVTGSGAGALHDCVVFSQP